MEAIDSNNSPFQPTDEAIARAKLQLKELDERLGKLSQRESDPVFDELAKELSGPTLRGVRVMAVRTIQKSKILRQLGRLRRIMLPQQD